MKKILTLIMIIFNVLFLNGCFSSSFNPNKVVTPVSKDTKINGDWRVKNEIIIDKSLSNISDLNNSIISIDNNDITIGDTSIKNAKYKLKRINYDEDIDKVVKYFKNKLEVENIESIDIIDVYNDERVYFNFLSINDRNENYIYAYGSLLAVEKVGDIQQTASAAQYKQIKEKSEIINKINSTESSPIIEFNDKYYNMDVGVLLALKKPSRIDSNGNFEEATYRTMWISLTNNTINEAKTLDNMILVPRLNGFSKIELLSDSYSKGRVEKIVVTNNRQGEIESKSVFNDQGTYSEINFIGKDYVGLQYYDGVDFNNTYNKFKILPLDYINTREGIDLVSLFGEDIKDSYIDSEKKVKEEKIKNSIDYNLSEIDYKNATLERKNGHWNLTARLNSSNNEDEFIDFILNTSPIKVLVNYDGMIMPWNKLKEFNKEIIDSISAPNSRFIINLYKNKLSVYDCVNSNIGDELITLPMDENEQIIMAEWATGDYVTYWESIVNKYSTSDKDK